MARPKSTSKPAQEPLNQFNQAVPVSEPVKPVEAVAPVEAPKVVEPVKPVVLSGPMVTNDGPNKGGPVYPKVEAPKVDEFAFLNKEYFDKARQSGLDYSHKGKWQENYAKFLNAVFPLAGKVVLDLGCAFGAITSAIAEVSKSPVIGLDVSKHAKQVTPFKNFNFVTNSMTDMKDVMDSSVDVIHSMMSFQFISEENVEKLLGEVKRVAKPDAILFAIFPMAKDQNVKGAQEHLQTRDFWLNIAGKLGFKDGSKAFYTKLSETVIEGFNFMKEYNWNYIVYKIVK